MIPSVPIMLIFGPHIADIALQQHVHSIIKISILFFLNNHALIEMQVQSIEAGMDVIGLQIFFQCLTVILDGSLLVLQIRHQFLVDSSASAALDGHFLRHRHAQISKT